MRARVEIAAGAGTPSGAVLRAVWIAALCAYGALTPCIVRAEWGPTPLSLPNLNPLTHIYGTPSARPIRPADRIGVDTTVASHFVSEANAAEALSLDGETVRTALTLARRLTPTWALGAVVPHVRQGGGGLDRVINNWHRWFGLPDGGRDAAPLDAFDFRYRRADGGAVRTQVAGGGIGDVQLFADFAATRAWSLQTTLKLPTGDAAQLRGSGAADLAVVAAARTPFAPGAAPLAFYGHVGALARGRGDVLPAQARTGVGLAQAGVAWAPLARLTLQAQLDGHTGFYRDSDLATLGPALQLGVGGRWQLAADTGVSFAFAEDVAVATAPDVAFQLALDIRY